MSVFYIESRNYVYCDGYLDDVLGKFYFGSEEDATNALLDIKTRSSSKLELRGGEEGILPYLVERDWFNEKIKYKVVKVAITKSLPKDFYIY